MLTYEMISRYGQSKIKKYIYIYIYIYMITMLVNVNVFIYIYVYICIYNPMILTNPIPLLLNTPQMVPMECGNSRRKTHGSV